MLKIFNVRVYGLDESAIASGYPMQTKVENFHSSDSKNFKFDDFKVLTNEVKNLLKNPFWDASSSISTKKDFERLAKLGNSYSNSGHGNALTGIIVQFDITYPEYWSPEFQRYHFAQIVSSQSKMHRLANMNIESCCNEYVTGTTLSYIKELQNKYSKDPTYENYMTLLSNCPLGLEKTMRVSTNYLQLKTIYQQRRNHKLKEDWGAFCDWIESLPRFKELTGICKEVIK